MNLPDQEKSYELPTCSICIEDLADSLSVTKCGHVFHTTWYVNQKFFFNIENSILQSLSRQGKCPLCRERAIQGNLRELNFTVGSTWLIKISKTSSSED